MTAACYKFAARRDHTFCSILCAIVVAQNLNDSLILLNSICLFAFVHNNRSDYNITSEIQPVIEWTTADVATEMVGSNIEAEIC